MTSYKEKLNQITTFIFDVDGVLTNGEVILYQDEVVRTLNTRDCYAIQYAAKMGYRILIITGGHSDPLKKRLLHLGCEKVILSAENKSLEYEKLKEEYGFDDEQVAYMGDDLPDYEVMKKVGLATCPQDATVEVKEICHYQSPYNGGRHCVRDLIEQTLRVQGKWFSDQAFHW